MSSRHRARETALQILYRFDLAAQSAGTTLEKSTPQTVQEMLAELNGHFDHFQVPEDLRGFAAELVAGTLREIRDLDGLIEKSGSNWRLSRMAVVDRSLLRMAVYELTRMKDTPAAISINEAVELAKEFGNAETPAFVNGILDAIRKTTTS